MLSADLKNRILAWSLGAYFVSTLVAMAPMSIGTGLVLGAVLLAFGGPRGVWLAIRSELEDRSFRIYLGLSILLALACVASLISASLQPMGYGSKFVTPNLLLDSGKVWYLFWPLVLVPAMRRLSSSQRAGILKAWLIAFGVLSVVGIFQFYTGWPRPQQIPGNSHFHATVFLGHHLSLASIFIFPFFAILDLARSREASARLGLPRPLLLLGIALGLCVLFMAFSRMLWIALPVGLLIWSLWNLPRKWAVLTLMVIATSVWILKDQPVIQGRFRDTFGASTRQELWKANWEFFKERPVFGVGWRHNEPLSGIFFNHIRPGRSFFQGHAHNNFIHMLSGTGVVGAMAWVLWCVWGIVLAKGARGDPAVFFSRGLVCAWVVFHINGLTQVNFWEGKVTHQVMWMVSLSLLGKRGER